MSDWKYCVDPGYIVREEYHWRCNRCFLHCAHKELGGKVQGTLGDFNREDIRGLLNLPMTENGGIKLWGSRLKNDGYIKNTTFNDWVGGQNFSNVGATIAYDITEDFDVSFTYERTEDKSDVGAFANFQQVL
ncbi:MAG: hypothetical protein IPG64_22070 [Haliea sp.]|nr:hypothetical protein [Haliea sp.]